jgi:hypothetical protein
LGAGTSVQSDGSLAVLFQLYQVPGLSRRADGTAASIKAHRAARAGIFRWSALSTWVWRDILEPSCRPRCSSPTGVLRVGIGAWQDDHVPERLGADLAEPEEVLNLYQYATIGVDAEEQARRTAFLASRINMMLSIPMLFFMVASGGIFQRAFFP